MGGRVGSRILGEVIKDDQIVGPALHQSEDGFIDPCADAKIRKDITMAPEQAREDSPNSWASSPRRTEWAS